MKKPKIDKAQQELLERQTREKKRTDLLMDCIKQLHDDKNIPRDTIFEGIEAAIQMAAERHFGASDEEVVVAIDRANGKIHATKAGVEIDPEILGRIAAQSAKQMMIQKIREAECNSVFDEYAARKGDKVMGTVQRFEGGAALVTVDKSECILPRGEQIPGETFHVGERVTAVILDVRKQGHRVKIILSRTHPDFVRRLFEKEIPEIGDRTGDRTIEIRAIAREAGYRTKIAVSSIDLKVDCVGACVGVRGSRIKNIVDALGGERIDIVRWNDSLQVMIPNALQPASIEEVFLYSRLGRAIVLVKEDQLSLAIGRRGQNVRLASKLVGWDIEIMTHEELNEGIEKAERWFSRLPGATPELVEAFIEEGFLSYDDLTFLEPAQMGELAGVSEDVAEEMISYAEEAAERGEPDEPEEDAGEEAATATAVADAPTEVEASTEEGHIEAEAAAEEALVTEAQETVEPPVAELPTPPADEPTLAPAPVDEEPMSATEQAGVPTTE
jgi:N utilization substance protein A